jgi:hypothetical protein
MNAFENRLLIIWCAFTALSVLALIPVIIWAIRSGQFSNNTAAKYLPLKSGVPEDSVARSVGAGWHGQKRSVAMQKHGGKEDSKNVSS